MKHKEITIEFIAKQLNISKVSVHKALTNKDDVSAELKQRVLDFAVANNYKLLDPLTKLCREFYYITPQRFIFSTEQFYNDIYIELQNHLAAIDIRLEHVIADSSFTVEDFIKHRNHKQRSPYGVFWAGFITESLLKDFTNQGIPIVCIDNYMDDSKASFVSIDQYHAGYRITDHLIKQGHERICFVIETAISSNVDKFYGFQKALLMNGITFDENMHINLSLSKSKNFMQFELPNVMPSAFLFDSDHSARNFMISMVGRGYSIPDDFSVASFDNTRLSEETVPKLTSIGATRKDIIRSCYRVMLKTLETNTPQVIVVDTILNIRDSVKAKEKSG